MNKRGQVTIFIIVALFIVVGISTYLALKKEPEKISPEQTALEKTQVQVVAQKCLDDNLLEAVILLGFQGGWITLPQNYLETAPTNIGYAYYLGKVNFPSTIQMQADISNYINFALPFCFNKNNFTDFKVTTSAATSQTAIYQDYVKVNVNFPIIVTKENVTSRYITFSTSVPIRLGEMHNYVSGIINNVIADPQYVEVTYLLTPRYNISYTYDNNDVVVYTILDSNSSIFGEPYTFKLATKSTL